jgi:hypothetical protein
MLFVVEKHLGQGNFEPVGEAEASGENLIVDVFDELNITEHADYRVGPKGYEGPPAFYRLQMDGVIAEIAWPSD